MMSADDASVIAAATPDASPVFNHQQPRPVSPFPTTTFSTHDVWGSSNDPDQQQHLGFQSSLSLLSATSEPFKPPSSPLLLLEGFVPLEALVAQKEKALKEGSDGRLSKTEYEAGRVAAIALKARLKLEKELIAALPKGHSKGFKRGILLTAYKLEAAVRKHVETVQGATVCRMPRLRSCILQAFHTATHFSRLSADQVMKRLSPHLNKVAAEDAASPESAAVIRAVARGESVHYSTRDDVARNLHDALSFAAMAAFGLRVVIVWDVKGARDALEDARNAPIHTQRDIILLYAGGSRYGAITYLKAAKASRAAESRAERDAEGFGFAAATEVVANDQAMDDDGGAFTKQHFFCIRANTVTNATDANNSFTPPPHHHSFFLQMRMMKLILLGPPAPPKLKVNLLFLVLAQGRNGVGSHKRRRMSMRRSRRIRDVDDQREFIVTYQSHNHQRDVLI